MGSLGFRNNVSSLPLEINIGGEGETFGVLNVNGIWLTHTDWRSSEAGKTLAQMEAEGHSFLLPTLHPLPFADASVGGILQRRP